MKSLRGALTLWVWVTIGVVGAVSAVVAIWQAQQETQEQVDYQMQQVAHIMAGQAFSTSDSDVGMSDPEVYPVVHVHHDKDDDLIVSVRDADGRLLYASHSNKHLPGKRLPDFNELGFQTRTIGKATFRVFAARSDHGLQIQVAQSMDVIREAEAGIAAATLLPIGLLLPLLAIVLGWAVRRQLQPLKATTAAVASRPPLSLDLLPAAGVPAEVSPLIEEINRLLRRLGTAMEREKQFVTDAAHALRTPLTALQIQAEILDGGDGPQERAARLADLRSGIRRIIHLSEQLLSHARSQSETGPITVTSELDPTLADIVAYYAPTAQSKQVEVELEAASAVRVYGNSRRLTLIFGNLLDNALRFTPSGGRICIRSCRIGERARVEVWDEGCGLAPDELERVFERFYQASAIEGSGSGLGLATVAALVEQLGGEVRLENRVDRSGLVGIVTLPIAPVEAPAPQLSARAAEVA
jgi:two-component system, OmpR family, sensor kinase